MINFLFGEITVLTCSWLHIKMSNSFGDNLSGMCCKALEMAELFDMHLKDVLHNAVINNNNSFYIAPLNVQMFNVHQALQSLVRVIIFRFQDEGLRLRESCGLHLYCTHEQWWEYVHKEL